MRKNILLFEEKQYKMVKMKIKVNIDNKLCFTEHVNEFVIKLFNAVILLYFVDFCYFPET